jgi:hypothetical protein
VSELDAADRRLRRRAARLPEIYDRLHDRF